MILTGYAVRIEHDLWPATIIDPIHAASADTALLAAYCLVEVAPSVAEQAREGDILVVCGQVFDGPGTEDAVYALQALGLAAIICAAAAAPFTQAAGQAGLPVLVQPTAAQQIRSGDLLRLDLARGRMLCLTADAHATRSAWDCCACPTEIVQQVQRMHLLMWMRRVAEDEGFAE